jgi:hypothetical protein
MGHSYGVMKLVSASSVMGGLLLIYFYTICVFCSVGRLDRELITDVIRDIAYFCGL